MKENGFWKSALGQTMVTAMICIAIWGIIIGLYMSEFEAATLVIVAVCTYFGWVALTMIQPAMFIWMPIAGWIIYFVVKFILSFVIGIFVAPFVIGKKVSSYIYERL